MVELKVLVSIMIPAYNQPQYIQQAVQSALDQDYDYLEVIVSDDSTDAKTQELIQPFLADKRFSYYKNQSRLGRVANYRKLLYELANGEWVVMLDGDDYYIDPSYISKALGFISQDREIILAGAGIKVFTESNNKLESFGLEGGTQIFEGKDVFSKYKRLPNHQTDLYLRNLACQLDFYRDPSTGSDSESLYRLCLHGKVAYYNKDVAVWRVHSKNTTYIRDLGTQIKEMAFINSVYRYALNFLDKQVAKTWRNHMFKYLSLHLLNMAIAGKNYWYVFVIILRFWRYMGVKTSLIYLSKTVGFYKRIPADYQN